MYQPVPFATAFDAVLLGVWLLFGTQPHYGSEPVIGARVTGSAYLKNYVRERGGKVIAIFAHVGSGWDATWIGNAVDEARENGAKILFECVNRAARHPAYHGESNFTVQARTSELVDVRNWAKGVELVTVLHPNATSEETTRCKYLHMTAQNVDSPVEESASPFRYIHSDSFLSVLDGLSASLFVSTYQAGKLMVARAVNGRLSTLLRSFEQPMGLAIDGRSLAVGTRNQVWFLRNAPDIAAQIEPPGQYDACYIPRSAHVTGDIRGHEIVWVGEELWIVNTRFSCLCALDDDYSFVSRWRPKFVTEFTADDRCHLNGLAVVDGKPKYVTALGESDAAEGWRETKASGGVIIDVPSNEVIARGLCMPHSPRVHDGKLWVLDSGAGRLVTVDPDHGRTETVADLPGYPRGLDFCGRYAFVKPAITYWCWVWAIRARPCRRILFVRFCSQPDTRQAITTKSPGWILSWVKSAGRRNTWRVCPNRGPLKIPGWLKRWGRGRNSCCRISPCCFG